MKCNAARKKALIEVVKNYKTKQNKHVECDAYGSSRTHFFVFFPLVLRLSDTCACTAVCLPVPA